jgi:hypothetical protein
MWIETVNEAAGQSVPGDQGVVHPDFGRKMRQVSGEKVANQYMENDKMDGNINGRRSCNYRLEK